MDINKMSEEEKLNISKKYFVGGFFLLPWLWLLNAAWFFPEARKSGGNSQIRRYVIFSAIGALLWAVAIATWAAIFQMRRGEWGEQGDSLTVFGTIPKGRP